MKIFGEEIEPDWLVWIALFYGGAALIGLGTGEYATSFGGTMLLHAVLITWARRH